MAVVERPRGEEKPGARHATCQLSLASDIAGQAPGLGLSFGGIPAPATI